MIQKSLDVVLGKPICTAMQVLIRGKKKANHMKPSLEASQIEVSPAIADW
jgi:hypothetical protein